MVEWPIDAGERRLAHLRGPRELRQRQVAGDLQSPQVGGEDLLNIRFVMGYHKERSVQFIERGIRFLMTDVTFYFDVGSPYAYLAAERLPALLPEPVHWQPVLLGGLFRLTGRSSWALGDYRRRQAGMAEIERRTRSYGLPPMR